jgi:type I restriction enzyme S subunit
MKKGWEIKTLGEIADVEYGFTDKSTDEGDYRYVRITDINNNGELTSTEKKYLKHSKEAEAFLLKDNDLLMARTGATYAKVLLYENFEASVFASYLIRIKFKEKIENKLYWYFSKSNSYWDQANSLASGAAQPHFNGAAVKQVKFPYPKSLSEQQRIVSILDESFAVINKAKANAEQNLKNARELFESYLQGVFEKKGDGWEEKTLRDISLEFGRGKSKHRPRNWEGLYGGKYPFIQTGDIRNCNHFITEYSQTYNDTGLAQSKLWPAGTICITIAANIAETGILTFDACFPDSVIGIVVNENLAIRGFVEYLLQSFKTKIQSLSKGSAQANINLGTFENEMFPIPPIKIQKQIVTTFDNLSQETQKLESIYQKKIADLEELKKSLLEKAFLGEL